MTNNDFLSKAVDWLGVVFEKLNPSAFRFLAAFLPYLSPVPVSVVTAASAGKFLGFDSTVAFILVFVLGGIGLWFTSLLVDAVVDYIRGGNYKDLKSLAIVLLFFFAIIAYIGVEIGLNVAIHDEDTTPQRQVVIFLLSMLPLITGIGNGYYKLKLQQRTDTEVITRKQEDLAEKIRQEKRLDKENRWRIKRGLPSLSTVQYEMSVPLPQNEDKKPDRDEHKDKPASWYKEKMWQFMDTKRSEGKIVTVKEIVERFGLDYDRAKGFVSTQRTLWAKERGVDLTK